MSVRVFFMVFVFSFAGCSLSDDIVDVKVTDLDNQAVAGVLGPTLRKFGGGNISGKSGYVKVPSTGVYIIFKRGFRPILINALERDPPKSCKLERLGEREDFGVLYEALEKEKRNILTEYYGKAEGVSSIR